MARQAGFWDYEEHLARLTKGAGIDRTFGFIRRWVAIDAEFLEGHTPNVSLPALAA